MCVIPVKYVVLNILLLKVWLYLRFGLFRGGIFYSWHLKLFLLQYLPILNGYVCYLFLFIAKLQNVTAAKQTSRHKSRKKIMKMFNQDEGEIECVIGNREICFWQGKKAELSGFTVFICLWLLVQPSSTHYINLVFFNDLFIISDEK